jgi:hypothetical protein
MRERVKDIYMDVETMRFEYNTQNVIKVFVGEYKEKFFYWWDIRLSMHGSVIPANAERFALTRYEAEKLGLDAVLKYLKPFDGDKEVALRLKVENRKAIVGQIDLFR